MKIFTEQNLRNFNFWSGAKDTAAELTFDDLDTIESMLEDCYPDGIDETALNDFFWFECDTIAEWLGYEDWDDMMAKRKE